MGSIPKIIENIRYKGKYNRRQVSTKSLTVIGIDTEAYVDGKCFMLCTSKGDVWMPKDFPRCLFSRKYQNCNLVAYNLKYDSGAFIQRLPKKSIRKLQETDTVTYQGYRYKIIGHKYMSIRKGSHTVHIYDMYGFYTGSLDKNAKQYLGEEKIDIETKTFSREYVRKNWSRLAEYCIHDAKLVQRLADIIIERFENFDVYPKKLYSTAYISYHYFSGRCKYPIVKTYWDEHRRVLAMAMESYQGGKFEVTKKLSGKLWEYDIISAYPYEIANLIDITNARVEYCQSYRITAKYGFIYCKISVLSTVFSPVARQRKNVCTYPVGDIVRTITKQEYEYLISVGCKIEIYHACYLYIDRVTYPFRDEIRRLVELKQIYKKENKELDLHTIKIFLNSLYGKFAQLNNKHTYWEATACWNPIYATVICANVRIRISQLQQRYKSVIAVHTDSIISTSPLRIPRVGSLGDLIYETCGYGAVLGSGVYQVGKKSAIRGFHVNAPLLDLLDSKSRNLRVEILKAHTWREVAFRGWDTDMINRFSIEVKKLSVDFDRKRIWLNDYKYMSDIFDRPVLSTPLISGQLWS